MRKIIIRWLICPILIGLIPIFLRFIISLHQGTVERFNASDLIAFGLVLSIHNLTQILYINEPERLWNTLQIIFSSVLIAVYSIYFSTYLENQTDIKVGTYILIAISLFIGIVICYRSTKKEKQK